MRTRSIAARRWALTVALLVGFVTVAPLSIQAQSGKDRPIRGRLKHDKDKPGRLPCPYHDRVCPPDVSGTAALALSAAPDATPGAPGAASSPRYREVVDAMGRGAWSASRSAPVEGSAQRALFDVLTGAAAPEGSALARALAADGDAAALGSATAVAQAMRALGSEPGRLAAAVETFNAFVDASSAAYLKAPPAEFVLVHDFLSVLVEEADAQEGPGQ